MTVKAYFKVSAKTILKIVPKNAKMQKKKVFVDLISWNIYFVKFFISKLLSHVLLLSSIVTFSSYLILTYISIFQGSVLC